MSFDSEFNLFEFGPAGCVYFLSSQKLQCSFIIHNFKLQVRFLRGNGLDCVTEFLKSTATRAMILPFQCSTAQQHLPNHRLIWCLMFALTSWSSLIMITAVTSTRKLASTTQIAPTVSPTSSNQDRQSCLIIECYHRYVSLKKFLKYEMNLSGFFVS
jgi:hypothetical protein